MPDIDLDKIWTTGAFATDRPPIMNGGYGGTHGVQTNYPQYHGFGSHMQRPGRAIVLRTPLGYDYLPAGTREWYIGAYVALFEQRAEEITGLDQTLEAEFTETNIGGSKQVMEDLSNVTRARSNLSLRLTDPPGRPYQRLAESTLLLFGMDDQIKIPRILSINADIPANVMALPEFRAGVVLFYVPDISEQYIDKAWLLGNVGFKGGGDNKAGRNLQNALEKAEITLDMTCWAQMDEAAIAAATSIHRQLNAARVSPAQAPAFMNAVDSNVADQATGAKALVDQIANAGVAARA